MASSFVARAIYSPGEPCTPMPTHFGVHSRFLPSTMHLYLQLLEGPFIITLALLESKFVSISYKTSKLINGNVHGIYTVTMCVYYAAVV